MNMRASHFARRALLGVSAAALLPAIAYAQSSGAPVAAPTAAEPAGTVTEVVVTAQRRSELLRDVPITVNTANAQQLERAGVTNTQDLTMISPGLKVDRVGAYTTPAIRGITTQLTQPGNDANVAIYVDGVYQPNQAANTFDLPDINRVEVLKGPQGTLFGRNATGGAIQIFTLDPSDTPTGQLSATYGSFHQTQFKGYLAGPIVPGLLGASFSAYRDNMDGYMHNIVSDRRAGYIRSTNLRGKLLFTPTDNMKFLASGFYMRRKDQSDNVGYPLHGNTINRVIPGAVFATRDYDVAFNGPSVNDTEAYGGNIRATIDLDPGTFSLIAAAQRIKSHIWLDADYGYTPAGGVQYILNTPDVNATQEINFASRKFGRFSFIAGLFSYYDKAQYNPINAINDLDILGPTSFGVSIWSIQKSQSYAAYFEGNFDLTDRITLIGGLRQSYEHRTLDGSANFFVTPTPTYPRARLGSTTWHSLTPRASIRYKINEETNAYFTYNQGFKSGAFDPSGVAFGPVPAAPPPVDPEKVKAYEVGLKGSYAGRFTYNLAAFRYNYTNQQVNSYVFRPECNCTFAQLFNAASSKIYGAEGELTANLTDNFNFRGGISYLHAKYRSFPNAVLLLARTPAGTGNVNSPPTSVKGNYLIRSPKWSGNLSANYTRPLDAGTVSLDASVYFTSKFYFDIANRVHQPAYATLQSRAAFKFNNGVRVSVWGKNLTDERIIQGAFLTVNADGVSLAAPRSGGITIDYSF